MDFLDLLGVPYHAPGVFFLGTDFLFKSILAFCDIVHWNENDQNASVCSVLTYWWIILGSLIQLAYFYPYQLFEKAHFE